MSDIKQLIEAVREDGELTVSKLSDTITTQEIMFDMLAEIKEVLVDTQVGLFEFFNAEQERYNESVLAQTERLREAAGTGAGGPQGVGGVVNDPTAATSEGSFGAKLGFGALAAALTAAVSGYVFGLIKTLGQGFKDIGGRIAKVLKLDTVLAGIQTALQNAVKSFKGGTFVTQASVILEGLGKTLINGFKSLSAPIINFFKPLTEIPKLFSLSGEAGFVSKILEKIKGVVKSIGGYFGKIFTGVSKLAAPITALIGIFNAGAATLDDVEEGASGFWGIFGSLFENLVTELTSAFVTLPAELIKDLISWIAGKLGFDNVEATLDSFDIDEMFREGIGGIFDLFGELFTRASDALYSLRKNLPGFLGGIGDADIDLEAEQRIAQREVTAAAQDVADIDINEQNQNNPRFVDAMKKYDEAVTKRDDVSEQLQQQAVESSQSTAEGMEALADAGTTPGSIYTHDEHVVEKLNEINTTLGGGSSIQATESLVTNFEKDIINNASPVLQRVNQEMQRLDVGNMDFEVPVNRLLNAPIAQASKEMAAASAAGPTIISAPSRGGDTVNNNVQNSTTNVIPSGAPSRSSSPAHLRAQDRQQGAA